MATNNLKSVIALVKGSREEGSRGTTIKLVVVSARCEDFFGCFLFLVVLSHVISLRVFPNEVFLTQRARKGTFVMCS